MRSKILRAMRLNPTARDYGSIVSNHLRWKGYSPNVITDVVEYGLRKITEPPVVTEDEFPAAEQKELARQLGAVYTAEVAKLPRTFPYNKRTESAA